MSAAAHAGRAPVFFCFADPVGFSGQKAATELVIRGLAARGWNCRRLPQPVLERDGGRRLPVLRYALGLLAAWMRAPRLLLSRGGWLCVNLGQTRAAFLRDSVPLLLGQLGLGRTRVTISLHGSLFMRWAGTSLEARLFRFLLLNAGAVTVLGERQRLHLITLGVPAERVKVVINSCELEPISPATMIAKQEAHGVVRCLHLGSLIDTKGFPEYLEALQQLSITTGPRIEAVLCGRPTASEFSSRFPAAVLAEEWIEQKIVAINRSSRVTVKWIRGAVGAEKAALFRASDIFILPTRYAVEAQPLVLLEAMASGCAIITTQVGEISTILDRDSAVLLATTSPDDVAQALERLAGDATTRARLAHAAHDRFVASYGMEHHLDSWEAILIPGGSHEGNAP